MASSRRKRVNERALQEMLTHAHSFVPSFHAVKKPKGKAKAIALQELVEEEKQRILEEKLKENKQTSEQTPL
jgi:hypothetical protein